MNKEGSAEWEATAEELRRHEAYHLISHVRPDGDAYGSILGLGWVLRAAGKRVRCSNPDGLLDAFAFLPGAAELDDGAVPPEAGACIVALDCGDERRVAPLLEAWRREVDLNIDHHVSNTRFGRLNLIVPDAPATASILVDLVRSIGLPCPPEAAANFYVALATDTGLFRHPGVDAHTFDQAAWLTRQGADPAALGRACYGNYPPSRLLLAREALAAIRFSCDGRVAGFHLPPAAFATAGAHPSEADGLIDLLTTVRTVEVAYVLDEGSGDVLRVSLRSQGEVDVREIALIFGGGGHRNAAGFRSRRPAAEIESRLLEEIGRRLPHP